MFFPLIRCGKSFNGGEILQYCKYQGQNLCKLRLDLSHSFKIDGAKAARDYIIYLNV